MTDIKPEFVNVLKEFKINNKKVLEIGCGTGDFTKILQLSNDVTPTDIRPFKLKNFIQADARNLPFKSKSFDVVFGNFVLHHVVGDLDKVAKEAARILKPNGYYYGIEPNGIILYPWIFLVSYLLRIKPRCKGDDERALHSKYVKECFINNGFNVSITHRMTYLPIFHDKLNFIKNRYISSCMLIKARLNGN